MSAAGVATNDPKPPKLALFAIAYAATAALQKGLGFVIFVWLARVLTVEQYATLGLLYALQSAVAALTGAGIIERTVGMLKDHVTSELRGRLFASANLVFALQSVVCAALIVIVAAILPSLSEVPGLSLTCIVIGGVATAYALFQAQLARLEEHHAVSLLVSFVPPLAGWLVAILLFTGKPSVESLFAGIALGVVGALLAFRFARAGVYQFNFSRQDALTMLAHIAPFIVVVFVNWLSGYGNTYLIHSFFSDAEVARFTFAYTIAAVMQLVATSMNQVWIPRFLKLVHQTTEDYIERRGRPFFLIQGAALGLCAATVLVATPVLTGWSTDSFVAYRDINEEMFFLLTAYIVSIPWYQVQNYYFAHSKGSDLMGITLLAGVLGIGVWIFSMSWLGAIGAYLGFLLFTAMRTALALMRSRRFWKVTPRYDAVCLAMAIQTAGFLCAPAIVERIVR